MRTMAYWLIPFACFISFCLGMLAEHVWIARNSAKTLEWAEAFGRQFADSNASPDRATGTHAEEV